MEPKKGRHADSTSSNNSTTVMMKGEEEPRYVVPPETTSNEENEYATIEDVVKRDPVPYRSQAISRDSNVPIHFN